MIEIMDEGIGKVMQTVHDLGLSKNTMVFNLEDDLAEKENLLDQYPEKQDQLLEMLIEWEQEVNSYDLVTQ